MFAMNHMFGGEGMFKITYRCFSVSMFPSTDKHQLEEGGKIIMPSSALDRLTRLNVEYPMLFKLLNPTNNCETHCGVLEFVADEGRIYIPYWMMIMLALDEGSFVEVESVSVPIATFSKFQPLNFEFLDISNPKAVLENALRNFACLTKDDVISIQYNEKTYDLKVLEVKPGNAVSIIECDMNVDFAVPPGYEESKASGSQKEDEPKESNAEKEAEKKELMAAAAAQTAEKEGFLAFHGTGSRLDGKTKNVETPLDELITNNKLPIGIPDYNYQPGYIKFFRNSSTASNSTEEENKVERNPFSGEGTSLRDSKK